MEVSFKREIEHLRLGAGQIFRGEGILAVTKALLQSGVAYVGGYQGAPVSHLLDVLVQAEDLMTELGIKVEAAANEAAAAAMLGASVGYPLRGAVTWKSIVGTNVASDALSNLASTGVTGGVVIILGEDYGEGASVIQERSHAFALKSSVWLLDPRPNLPTIVRMVEKGFDLSEASNTPVMLELRIRACHLYGEFTAKDNVPPAWSARNRLPEPYAFDYGRLSHPPATFVQERDKVNRRLPAAHDFILREGLNEIFGGDIADVAIICQGGLFNTVLGRLRALGLADAFGRSRIPILCLNVTYPLVPSQIVEFCAGRRSVLIVEEGFPDYIEQAVLTELHRAGHRVDVHGKDLLPKTGELNAEALHPGLLRFMQDAGVPLTPGDKDIDSAGQARILAESLIGELPERPPTFCVGCPERPVFSALKLVQRETGPLHVAADIGCHALATFAPFSSGNTILGYGMSLASAAAVSGTQSKPPISIMGDGGFWHNGLTTGVIGSVFNRNDGVLIVLDNGYSSATGIQSIPSTQAVPASRSARLSIQETLRAVGVRWQRTVHSYDVSRMVVTLREALDSAQRGLRVIVAEGECMLARQRRRRSEDRERLQRGERVIRPRFGIDSDVCTGDHSCIRLSGCPSLTVKENPDPLRRDPVAHVNNDCVGCGLCGEVAHAAQLCPSFYRADIVQNPTLMDRLLFEVRRRVVSFLGTAPAGTAI